MATFTKYPVVNNKHTQITNAPGTAGTAINVASAEALGFVNADCPYIATMATNLSHNSLNESNEIVLVTGMTPDTGATVLTVVREQEGTTALDLRIGDYISMRCTALHINSIGTQLSGLDLQANDAKLDVIDAVSGIVKSDGAGTISAAVEDTDYQGVLAEGAFVDGDKTNLDNQSGTNTGDQNAAGVTIADSGGLITATDVEGALAENRTAIDALEAVGATDDQTAAEILTALLTVDGTGSLLDADLLDGLDSLAFVKADGSVPFTGDVKVTSATLMLDRGADLAPAEPLVLGTDGNFFKITGAGVSTIATITGLNATHSTEVTLEFGGAITLTHGGGLQLPNDESRKTRPGDILKFIESSSGVWICTSWQTAFFEEESFVVALSGPADDVATGIAVESFRFPYAFSITEVRLSLVTAGITGLTTVDINYTGVGSILSTKLTIDSTEKTSTTAVAAAVLTSAPNTLNFGDDDEVTFDIDTVATGTAPKGLKVTLIGYRTP